MRSNTEGWSNTQLNDRIEELEDKLESIKSWYETRIRKYKEQIKEAKNIPPDFTQSLVSEIFLKGLEGFGEILEAAV